MLTKSDVVKIRVKRSESENTESRESRETRETKDTRFLLKSFPRKESIRISDKYTYRTAFIRCTALCLPRTYRCQTMSFTETTSTAIHL